MKHALDPLLKPRSIALVGASAKKDSPGHVLARMIFNSDYFGAVYPVNPGYEYVLERTCHPSLASLPETVDHVVLAVGNERLEQALADAIAHGARAATIYSSCVLDDDTSPPLKDRLKAMAASAGMAICGGNGMGFYNLTEQIYAGIFPKPSVLPKGTVSLIAQSGSAFTAFAHNGVRLKFNLCVSSGNEMATSVSDYMDWALCQKETRVIGLFLETVRNPSGFVRALGRARERSIPIVMLKVGRSPLGAAMAVTHTGAIAGDHAAYEALARKFGVIEVRDFGEMAAALQVFQSHKQVGMGSLATIHESGGLMELSTDLASDVGVPLARIDASTKTEIARYLDPGLKPDNPLDAWGSPDDFENRFYHCLSALMRDPNVAAGMFVSNFRDGYFLSEALHRVVVRVNRETDKPLFMDNCHTDLAHRSLCRRSNDEDIPFFDGTREGMLAVKHLFGYRDFQARQPTGQTESTPGNDTTRWQQRLSSLPDGVLEELEAMSLFSDYGLATPRQKVANTREEVLAAVRELGFPVVLKTAEPGINHKSDQGGVRVNLTDEAAVTSAYEAMNCSLGPRVLVSEMIGEGTEIGLGMINDPQFGPLIMVSSGGILIEVLKDRMVALPPIDESDADQLVAGIGSDALIGGVRGGVPKNRRALLRTIVAFSRLCTELGDCIQEIDINPVIVNEQGAVAVDGLVVGRPRRNSSRRN